MLAALLLAACTPLPTCGAVAPPSATAALVQHAGKDAGTVASSSLAFPAPNAAGNFIAVVIRAGSHTGHILSVTDTRGNTYQKAIQRETANDTVSLALFYAFNAQPGLNTVTVSDSTVPGTLRFAILEYVGVGLMQSAGVFAEGNSGTASVQTPSGFVIGAVSTSGNSTVTGSVRESVASKLYAIDSDMTATVSQSQAWTAIAAGFVGTSEAAVVSPCGTPTPTIAHNQNTETTLSGYTLYYNVPGGVPQKLIDFDCEHYDLDGDGSQETRFCRCADMGCPVQRYCPNCAPLNPYEFSVKAYADPTSGGRVWSAAFSNVVTICMPPIYPGRPAVYQ